MKNILHINSFYLTNKLHYFFCHYSGVENESYFIPVYKNGVNDHSNVLKPGQRVYKIYSAIDKRLFFTKIAKCCWVAVKNYDIRKHDYIHAYTLFSDGLPALVLAGIYGKKLVITVRNTDINFFIKKSRLCRWLGRYALKHACQVFVPSHAYMKQLTGIYPFLGQKGNLKVLRNGVAPFWIEHASAKTGAAGRKGPLSLLFVGRLEENKNLQVLIRYLRRHTLERGITLHIVGENRRKWDFDAINDLEEQNSLVYHGVVHNERDLLEIYRSCDVFVMLSRSESFGLVYIEAMTQGLPVIYTRGEGIDGFFENGHVGYSCNPDDIDELHDVLQKVVANYETLSANAYAASLTFDWENVVREYNDILC